MKIAPPSPAFSDVVPALARLRSSHPTLKFGVATTKPTFAAEGDLKARSVPASLRGYFSHVQGTDSGMSAKPAPDVILASAAGLGVDPSRAIYIGDTQRDHLAAKRAGCAYSVLVRRGDEGNEDRLGAEVLVRSFLEIEVKCKN